MGHRTKYHELPGPSKVCSRCKDKEQKIESGPTKVWSTKVAKEGAKIAGLPQKAIEQKIERGTSNTKSGESTSRSLTTIL